MREVDGAYYRRNILSRDRYAFSSIMVWASIMFIGLMDLCALDQGYIQDVPLPHIRHFRVLSAKTFVLWKIKAHSLHKIVLKPKIFIE